MDKKMQVIIKMIPVLVCMFMPLVVPAPAGLDVATWHVVGVFLSLLFALVLKPFNEAVGSLIVLGLGTLVVDSPATLYQGFANETVWFICSVLLACSAFQRTGLGKRIAYFLLRKLSKTPFAHSVIGLGYMEMLVDLVLSPATGSNTPRSAIVFGVFSGIADSLGSTPKHEPRKIGAYLELLEHVVTMATAVLFLTGQASNSVIASTIYEMTGIELTWGLWFQCACVPAIVILLLSPVIVYLIYPPQMRRLEGVDDLIKQATAEMGPISDREKKLLGLFVFAILGWTVGAGLGISTNAVGFIFLALVLLLGVLDWNDLMAEKGAWSMLVWCGAFFGVIAALSAGGFHEWLATQMASVLDLSHVNEWLIIAVLVLISFLLKYFFVSNATHVATIYPVIFTLASTTGVNTMVLALFLAYFGGYGCLLNNYGNGASIYLYSNGYVSMKDWFVRGTAILLVIIVIFTAFALPWWKFLGIW